jgi:hypothetical protein
VIVALLATPGAALLVELLERLCVVLLVMLPVTLLRGLFVMPLITLPVMLLVTLLMTLPVPLLITWFSAPTSRSAIPAKASRDENRRDKYCIRSAPLCKEIVSGRENI